MGEERRLHVELHLEWSRGSNLEGLKLVAHVINLVDEVIPSLFSEGERLMEVGKLGAIFRAGRMTMLRVSFLLKISKYRYGQRWRWLWWMCFRGNKSCLQHRLL